MNRLLAGGVLALLLVTGASVRGGGLFCHHCGCECEVQKVCHVVCEMKETTKTVYSAKCEDFCVPCKSQRCPKCDQCDCDCGFKLGTKTYDWIPGCAQVRTKKVLMKKEEKVKVPTYKWVVEYLCSDCASHCQQEDCVAPAK